MDSRLISDISEKDFDKLTFENSYAAMVFFTANRCNVCSMLTPIVEEIAYEYKESINVFSVNVDELNSLAVRFRLTSIPTLLIFKDGEVKERIIGFNPKKVLEDRLEFILK